MNPGDEADAVAKIRQEHRAIAEAHRAAKGQAAHSPFDTPRSPWKQPPPQEHRLDPEAMETLRAIQRELSRLANGLLELNDMVRTAMEAEQ